MVKIKLPFIKRKQIVITSLTVIVMIIAVFVVTKSYKYSADDNGDSVYYAYEINGRLLGQENNPIAEKRVLINNNYAITNADGFFSSRIFSEKKHPIVQIRVYDFNMENELSLETESRFSLVSDCETGFLPEEAQSICEQEPFQKVSLALYLKN